MWEERNGTIQNNRTTFALCQSFLWMLGLEHNALGQNVTQEQEQCSCQSGMPQCPAVQLLHSFRIKSPLSNCLHRHRFIQSSSDIPEKLHGSGALLKTLNICKQSTEMTVQVTRLQSGFLRPEWGEVRKLILSVIWEEQTISSLNTKYMFPFCMFSLFLYALFIFSFTSFIKEF